MRKITLEIDEAERAIMEEALRQYSAQGLTTQPVTRNMLRHARAKALELAERVRVV